MRGVHKLHGIYGHCNQGSSPHARGPLQLSPPVDGALGIIPACAGSTGLSISLNRFT